MSSTCKSCGGSIGNPFNLGSAESDSCQCNLGGIVSESEQLPAGNCCVVSVNGKVGVVVLNINDIDLLGNQFFSNNLVYQALSAAAPINFNAGTGEFSHNNSGVTAGTYGNAGNIPIITVDAKGHITSINQVSISSISIGPDLTAIEALTGTGYAVRIAADTWALRAIQGTAGRINVSNGDAVVAETAIDLAQVGVVPGVYGGAASYPIITVDQFGRVTAVSTSTFPTPVLPPHTHSLGDLSNVANAVDTSASNGQVLTWNSGTSQWEAQALPTPTTFDEDVITIEPDFEFCKGASTLDAVEIGENIDRIHRYTDSNDLREVSLNAVVYCNFSFLNDASSGTGPNIFYGQARLGSVPAGYEPIHATTIACSAMIRGKDYLDKNGDPFTGDVQILNGLSIIIQPNGVVYLLFQWLADYVLLKAVAPKDIVIVSMVGNYPTKEIVP